MLSNPANANIFLSSKSFEKDTFANQEYYYKVPYDRVPISEKLRKAIYSPTKADDDELELGLPPVNQFIPKNFEIVDLTEFKHSTEQPVLIQDLPNS